MPSNAPYWGGLHHSKDYELFMEGDTPISKPTSLLGTHAVTGPNQNLSDAVVRRYVEKVNGVAVDREQVIRAAQELSVTMTLFFGNALETPIKERARRQNCTTTMYSKRLCPAKSQEAHAYIWEKMIINPPVRVNDPITIQDTALADWQSEFRITAEKLIKQVGAFKNKVADAIPLYAISFTTEDCVLCTASPNAGAVAVGGAGVGEEIVVLLSDDRFASSSAPGGTVPAPTASIGTSVFTRGNVVLVGFSDLPATEYNEATDPAVGGTMISSDAGQNFTLDADIAGPIMAVGFFNNKYIAVGGVGEATATFYTSDDGVTWTSQTVPAALSATAFTCLSIDEINGRMYLGTSDGELYVVEEIGGGYLFTELTLPGTPTAIFAVAVFDEGRVGAAGKTATGNYYAETFDSGNTFINPTVGGSTQILALAGAAHHQVVANGAVARSRSILTDFEYDAVDLQLGATVTGNYTGIAFARDGYLTQILATTDTGEVMNIRDFSPFYA